MLSSSSTQASSYSDQGTPQQRVSCLARLHREAGCRPWRWWCVGGVFDVARVQSRKGDSLPIVISGGMVSRVAGEVVYGPKFSDSRQSDESGKWRNALHAKRVRSALQQSACIRVNPSTTRDIEQQYPTSVVTYLPPLIFEHCRRICTDQTV